MADISVFARLGFQLFVRPALAVLPFIGQFFPGEGALVFYLVFWLFPWTGAFLLAARTPFRCPWLATASL